MRDVRYEIDRMLRFAMMLALWLVFSSATSANQDAPAGEVVSIRSIPGLTGPDTHPEACVSCHIQMNDIGLDARLSTALRGWAHEVPEKILEVAKELMDSPEHSQWKAPSSCIAARGCSFQLH